MPVPEVVGEKASKSDISFPNMISPHMIHCRSQVFPCYLYIWDAPHAPGPLGQPVVDLEKYMESLALKSRSIGTMLEGISSKIAESEQSNQLHGCMHGIQSHVVYIHACIVPVFQNKSDDCFGSKESLKERNRSPHTTMCVQS